MKLWSSLSALLALFFFCSASPAFAFNEGPMSEAVAFVCSKTQTCTREDKCAGTEGQLLFVGTEAPDGVEAEHGNILWASSSEAPEVLLRIQLSIEGSEFDADAWSRSGPPLVLPKEMMEQAGRVRILVPDITDTSNQTGAYSARIYEQLYGDALNYTYYTLLCGPWRPI